MQPLSLIEQLALLILVFVVLSYLLWMHYQEWQEQSKKKDKKKPKCRKWRSKSPANCPACQEGFHIKPIQRRVKPWREYKSPRRSKKKIKTQGHACPNPHCRCFGITDETVHALVGNGKRGKQGHIQTFKCQCCQINFSSRRNTPLYHLKTHPDRVEMCLWLLAEGMDVSVLVRFTSHVDTALSRWLTRAGIHSEHLHSLLFVQLSLKYLQIDELFAPVAGNKRKSWLMAVFQLSPAMVFAPTFSR